jgi:hypothetical protein
VADDDDRGGLVPLPRRPNPDERKKALEDPGVPWGIWFYRTFLKVWIPLGFLIVDVWVVGYFLEAGEPYLALASLPVCLYLNYVGFAYCYAHPGTDASRSIRSEFRPTPLRPFEYGRWTPEGERIRAGLPPLAGTEPKGPDPDEFF